MPRQPTPHPDTSTRDVPLPPERAFVVQLRAQTDPARDLFIGRLEHIASGEARRFSSAAELLALIAEMGGARRSTEEGEETA
jgi:hypothetical protein